jgi:hypothetical protein
MSKATLPFPHPHWVDNLISFLWVPYLLVWNNGGSCLAISWPMWLSLVAEARRNFIIPFVLLP